MSTHLLTTAQHAFTRAVSHALRHRCGVRAAKKPVRLLLAVSGGADSVALLRSLAALTTRRTWHLQLAVGHVQHHLRPPEEAEGDAAFVEELAQKLELPFFRADLDLSKKVRDESNLESLARARRYEALLEMARTFDARFIVTGHQADDQLESILMRLLRGTSVSGMSAMAWRRKLLPGAGAGGREWLLRPMLAVDGAAARQFLHEIHQPWREDATNQDLSRWRARLRADVLPVLRELRPDAAQRAVHLADQARAMRRLLDDMIDRAADHVLLVPAKKPGQLSRASLSRADARQLPGGGSGGGAGGGGTLVLSGLLRRLLREAGVPADRLGARALGPVVRAVCDQKGGRRTFSFPEKVSMVVTREVVEVQWPWIGTPLKISG